MTSAAFDWSKFQEAPSIPSATFDWSKFQEEKPSSFHLGPSNLELPPATRHVARTASRIGETLLGLPGDIQQGLKSLVGLGDVTLPFAAKLPTSGELKEKTEQVSQGYLSPQGGGEKFSDELVSDLASFAGPGKLLKVPALKSLYTSIGTTLAGQIPEAFGKGDEGKQEAKIGASILLSLFNPRGASKYVSGLYQQASEALPKEAIANAKGLKAELAALDKSLQKGGLDPTKTKSLGKIHEIESKIKNGKIAIDELVEGKKSINVLRSGLYDEFKIDKSGRQVAKRNLDSVASKLDSALDEYGKQNPAWHKIYRDANAGFGAIQQSKKVSSYLGRIIKQNPHIAGASLAAELFTMPLGGTAAAGVAGTVGLKSGELIYRISKSPVLRRYYSDVVSAAVKQDAAEVFKSLAKLDAAMQKDSGEN